MGVPSVATPQRPTLCMCQILAQTHALRYLTPQGRQGGVTIQHHLKQKRLGFLRCIAQLGQ